MRIRLMIDVEINQQDIGVLQEQISTQPVSYVTVEGLHLLHGRLMGAVPVEVGD